MTQQEPMPIDPVVGEPIAANTPISADLPPVLLAFVIDNKVVDVLHTDERLASIFLSEPKVVDITPSDGIQQVFVDYTYDESTQSFSI